MKLLRFFIAFNRFLCRALDAVVPYPLAATFWRDYVTDAARLATVADHPVVIDVGAGRTTPYAAEVGREITLIGVDVLAEDMADNEALDQRIVRDVIADGMPEEVAGAGLVTSRMVVEHVPDLDRFAQELFTTLAPGGRTLHLFAARHSIFATLNRLLPEEAARRILFVLRPESVEVGGFRTYYDRTNAGAAEAVFRRAGFEDVEVKVSYEVSQYFHFFFPLFVLARLWETALHALKLRDLGSFVQITARKPMEGRTDHGATLNRPGVQAGAPTTEAQ